MDVAKKKPFGKYTPDIKREAGRSVLFVLERIRATLGVWSLTTATLYSA